MLSGEESEEKQNVLTFLKTSAKCNTNLSQEDINSQRTKFITDSFQRQIGMLLNSIVYGTTTNDKNEFAKKCNQIILETCKVLLNLKCVFNQNNDAPLKELQKKVKILLKNKSLFENIEQNVAELSSSVNANINISTDSAVRVGRVNVENNNNRFQKNEAKRKVIMYESVIKVLN